MRLTLDRIASVTEGTRHGAAGTAVDGFANDSRVIRPGECFVAIESEAASDDGPDGHDFVAHAFERGAAAALVTRIPEGVGGPLIVVADVFDALGALARSARTQELADARVVGITGSTGKTSTKDLLEAALAPARGVVANAASFNNEIGLPITLLGAGIDREFVICEMGARFEGNIASLCAIARPDVGVVTNIGPAHVEHLGGIAGVERVKGELLDAVPASGLVVLNADDPATLRLRVRTSARVITAGIATSADVCIVRAVTGSDLRAEVEFDTPWGAVRAVLGLRGAHQVSNAALAAAAALDAGVAPDAVAAGLQAAQGSSWRMDLTETGAGILVLNDAYNANPQSMAAALRAFGDLPVSGRRHAVLGEMRELGSAAEAAHTEIGLQCARHRIDVLVAVGHGAALDALTDAARSEGVAVRRVEHPDAARAELDLSRGDAVLVKASRAVGLESVAISLVSELGARPATATTEGAAAR